MSYNIISREDIDNAMIMEQNSKSILYMMFHFRSAHKCLNNEAPNLISHEHLI